MPYLWKTLLLMLVAAVGVVGSDQISGGKISGSKIARWQMQQTTTAPAPTHFDPAAAGWKMIFADEFDGKTLDQQRWTTCYWWDKAGCTIATNLELEWYQPENVTVAEGVLRLQARQQSVRNDEGKVFDYTSGMISSGRSQWEQSAPLGFAFHYGYAEIRAKVPAGKGLWSAFWLLPTSHESLPEIDVMEILGDAPQLTTMHLHTAFGRKLYGDLAAEWSGEDFSQDWHTFAVDWQPQHLIWYVDGVARASFYNSARIPHEPMYLIANLAVGGIWPGSPDETTIFPATLEIDWLRVWQP